MFTGFVAIFIFPTVKDGLYLNKSETARNMKNVSIQKENLKKNL